MKPRVLGTTVAVMVIGACLLRSEEVRRPTIEEPAPTIAVAVAYAEVNTAWSMTLSAPGVTDPFDWVLVEGPDGMTLDANTGELAWTPSHVGEYLTTVMLDFDDRPDVTESFTIEVRAWAQCVWSGALNDAWDDPGNWRFCGGQAPEPDDWVSIDGNAGVQPVVRVDTEVEGFDASAFGAGTISIAPDVTLVLRSIDPVFRSSVGFAGTDDTCDTCVVRADHPPSVMGATLWLGPGVRLLIPDHRDFDVGGGIIGGGIVTEGATDDPTTWPTIEGYPINLGEEHWNGLRFHGTSNDRAFLRANGLNLVFMCDHDTDGPAIDMVRNAVLERFDRVAMHKWSNWGDKAIWLSDCAPGEVQDFDWQDIELDLETSATAINVRVACDPGQRITISGSGALFGDTWEDDPNDVVDWQ